MKKVSSDFRFWDTQFKIGLEVKQSIDGYMTFLGTVDSFFPVCLHYKIKQWFLKETFFLDSIEQNSMIGWNQKRVSSTFSFGKK